MYKKSDDLLDLATFMQASSEGVSIQDIMDKFKVSRRTAIRMKDSLKEKYPNIKEEVGEKNIKRWSLPKSEIGGNQYFSLNEINAMQNAIKLMRSSNSVDADYLENMLNKIKVSMDKALFNRIEPDAEVLLETEGYALRAGPRIEVNGEFMTKLRNAILGCMQIRIKYQSKSNEGWRTVYPYGMLYGNKEWLLKRTELHRFENYDIWLSQEDDIPDYPYTYSMWQYTRQGEVYGIDGYVDLNISFIDYSAR